MRVTARAPKAPKSVNKYHSPRTFHAAAFKGKSAALVRMTTSFGCEPNRRLPGPHQQQQRAAPGLAVLAELCRRLQKTGCH
ncbi:hypothetical protein LP7551_04707 [Roseibium album]|nr:hypothetical protein LP7551_04707 [Roseibium album]